MKATITQLNHQNLESDWVYLIRHLHENQSELVLLPEMCFSQWFCTADTRDDAIWESAVESHDNWLKRLPELGTPIVVGTAPRNIEDRKSVV